LKDKNAFHSLLEQIDDTQLGIIEKLKFIIDYVRPAEEDDAKDTIKAINKLIDFFRKKDPLAVQVSDQTNRLFSESKISFNITSLDILSRNGLGYELRERFYDKFLPKPPTKGDLRYIFSTLFYKKDDHIWVNQVSDEKWTEFFSSLFSGSKLKEETQGHLFRELLYAAEILTILIASKENDGNFIRLDKSLLKSDSAFIALQRNIGNFFHKLQENAIDVEAKELAFDRILKLIDQCNAQVGVLEEKSLSNGISVELTYEIERLGQVIQRLKDILELIMHFDTQSAHLGFVEFFKESVTKNATKNSLVEVCRQSSHIIAKSITNNASEHGEHYITRNTQEYVKMFLSAAGAGIVIAFMALLKINLLQADFPQGAQAILASLNYGFGFVLIHLLGFTVATKQPAMTASSFAQAIEQEEGKRTANQQRLVGLVFQVSRSQFAAVMGNITLALSMAFGIAYVATNGGEGFLSIQETQYYLKGLEPVAALLFAGIAGIWLFFSGLIAGYFDNRADLLELEQRYFHQPLLKKLLSEAKRAKVAAYLHAHHGAIAGNFFFGVLLGLTPYVGHLLGLPLDIRHVAFSSAYLGFASAHVAMPLHEFLCYLGYVFLIGTVNLIVSFALALNVSLLSRDTYFGNLFLFMKRLGAEARKRPHQLFFPFGNKKE
jgi:site-specific recombinase